MTASNPDSSILSRVSALEATVQEIQRTIAKLKGEDTIEATAPEQAVVLRDSATLAPLSREAGPFDMVIDVGANAIQEPPKQARVICVHCGAANLEDRARCILCGWSLTTSPTPSTLEPNPEPKAQPVSEPPPPASRVRVIEAAPALARPVPPKPARSAPIKIDILKAAEMWLNKVGIVLFLFGVAFLFKYSIDKGWLNEQARIGMGLLFGSVLLVIGLRLHGKRRHFSQVLMGGSIATYYITGFAAYNIFPNLNIPYEVAFGFMALVTIAAFALSMRQDEAVLAIIGVTGGLLTPFILNRAGIELPGLVGYTCLVIAGASGIYLMKGWRTLLWTSVQGGCSILTLGYLGYVLLVMRPALLDRWSLQAGAVFMLFAFWMVPVVRDALFARDPARWPQPALPSAWYPEIRNIIKRHVHLLTVATPLIVLAYSALLWGGLVPREVWGIVGIGGAALLAATHWALRRYAPTLQSLAYTHAIVAIVLMTTGLVSLLSGHTLIFALAAEAAALHLIAWRFSDRGIAICGNLIFGAVGVWLAYRLMPGGGPLHPVWNAQALTDMAIIGIALAVSFIVRQRDVALIMRSCAHIALMAWIWREIHAYPNGDGYVMLAWAAYGLLLHIISRHITDPLNATGTSIAAHLAFEASVAILALRLATGYQGDMTMLNSKAVIDLGMMALALAASFFVRGGQSGLPIAATIYRLGVHVAALAWLWREATPLDLSGGYVMLRWAAYLAMVAFISHRVGDRITLIFTGIPFIGVAYMFAGRILSGHEGELAVLNPRTILDLCVMALALAVSFVAQPREAKIAYRLAIHAGVLGLLWRELIVLDSGWNTSIFQVLAGAYGYVMLAWALYLTALHLLARRLRDVSTSIFAHAGFFAVGGLLAWRLLTGPMMTVSVFNQKALFDLAVIALAACISFIVRPREAGIVYRYAVHAAVMALIAREFYWLGKGDGYIMLAWAAYATLLVLASRFFKGERMDWAGHAIFAVTGLWLVARFVTGLILVNEDQFAVLNPKGLTDFGVVALGAVMYLLARREREIGFAYALWLHFGFLGWTWQELGLIPNGGNGYVTIAWGIYGTALVVAGLRLGRNVPLLTCGITTLFAVAAKLFLIDLHYLDAIWRILLFLGFGGFFLLFSYFFQGAVGPGPRNNDPHQRKPGIGSRPLEGPRARS
ncbi:MAG TPA: DUF2339 domain-containing protein [Chloroflexia bacterium]|nr:DUF2339 domain-containing protein [Chloroflexia bacterium]